MAGQKIKILYCITKGNWGGAQKYVYDLATALPPDLYEVTVLLGSDGGLSQKLQAKGVRILIPGDISRDISLIKDFLTVLKLIKIFRRERPDIVHLNSSKMGLLGSIAGRLARVPKIIFTGHGWAFNEDRGKLQKKIIYALHLFTIALSHCTIAVSKHTKNQILKNNFYSHKITVIRNGLDETDFYDQNTAREKILEKLGQGVSGRLWLGTIAELHKNKGLKYLIEAIHLLETGTDDRATIPALIIIGDGERKEKLEQRISRYGLQDLVFLAGRIEGAERYLKAFDIFALTSITEALPYAVLEAGQAGLPIVASGVGGISEIIDDMENGILVRPKEPEEIQKAIDFLLHEPQKALTFGQKIRQKISTNFSKEEMVQKTLALYH